MTVNHPTSHSDFRTPVACAARVWFLQPEVHHYRLAVFDGVGERGRADGAYEVTVFGGLDAKGQCVGGGIRPYIRDCALVQTRKFGVSMATWRGIEDLLSRERPNALVMTSNPRMVQCWRLPTLAHSLGIPVVGWSKVHSCSRFSWASEVLKPRFYSRFDAMIVYGESARKELVGLGYARDRVFVAQNTIDTRRIFADVARISARGRELRAMADLNGKFVVLCIGRMDADKRHHDLLDAWPRLKEIHEGIRLVIVSGGPMLDEIRARARGLDPSNILVTGRVPEGDDYAWISTCDLGIYPGAVGLAINISLAFGKPTVVADEPGSDTEILEHGATGWRYPKGNLEAMVATVQRVIRDPQASRVVCARAQQLMRDTVTIDNMVNNIDSAVRLALAVGAMKNKNP